MKRQGQERTLSIGLNSPGMTTLHRAGLAGLWMTLQAFEREGAAGRLAGGEWSLSDDRVSLRVDGEPETFFDSLVRESFKVENGLVWFPALGKLRDNHVASALMNECLLGTFLQHPKTRKSDPAGSPGGVEVVPVDETEHPLRYRRIFSYQHQNVKIRSLDVPQRFVGWLYPGSLVRHEAFGVTGMQEPVERFLPLLYSVIGVLYFVVKSRGFGTRYAVVIPDVANLREYALFRQKYAPKDERQLTVSGAGEAALELLSTLKANDLTNAVGSTACRVMTFGKAQWSPQQKVRVQAFDVSKDLTRLDVYKKCRQFFQPRLVKPKMGEPFWDYPQTPGLVAENLLHGRSWWHGFSEYLSDKAVLDHVFGFSGGRLYIGEKEGLAKMVSETEMEDSERAFVEACHEAWRRRLGRLGQVARESGRPFGDVVEKELVRTRLSFSKCKNEATFRETLTDFWARAGSLPSLQSDWRGVLSLMNRNWRLARDLALLALASYAPREEEEPIASL